MLLFTTAPTLVTLNGTEAAVGIGVGVAALFGGVEIGVEVDVTVAGAVAVGVGEPTFGVPTLALGPGLALAGLQAASSRVNSIPVTKNSVHEGDPEDLIR